MKNFLLSAYRLFYLMVSGLLIVSLNAQNWQQNDAIYNTSGVPSLTFSAPRFADLDGDGDPDLTIGAYDGTFSYYENRNPVVAVDQETATIPGQFLITAVFPNPFNPATIIQYTLPERSRVRIDIYNVLGQTVETLAAGVQAAGKKSVQWDARGFSSGMYILRVRANGVTDSRKLILTK